MARSFALLLILVLAALPACAPASGPGGRPDGTTAGDTARGPRTMRMMVRNEVDSLQQKVSGPNAPERTRRLFNAELTMVDRQGNAHPYLAETLPQLNTDTW